MVYLTAYQQQYLSRLRAELRHLEEQGKAYTREWWDIAESIDSIVLGI